MLWQNVSGRDQYATQYMSVLCWTEQENATAGSGSMQEKTSLKEGAGSAAPDLLSPWSPVAPVRLQFHHKVQHKNLIKTDISVLSLVPLFRGVV